MRRRAVLTGVVLAVLPITACGGGDSGSTSTLSQPSGASTTSASARASSATNSSPTASLPQPARVDFNGTWLGKLEGEPAFEAKISDNHILINYVDKDRPNYRELYWVGTFPTTNTGKIVSVGDTKAMESALLASTSAKKAFVYEGDKIEFQFSVGGRTATIRLERQ
jgi:hypothetical protein